MDYFQQVVGDYLRSSRTFFVKPECLIQLDEGTPKKGRHWYCDFVAVDFAAQKVFLCEVTFSRTLHSLVKRMTSWSSHWQGVCTAIHRDCGIPAGWTVQPWFFIPEALSPLLRARFDALLGAQSEMPRPEIRSLESVLPWKYRSWTGEEYV